MNLILNIKCKSKTLIMASELFKKLISQVPEQTEKEVQLSMQIALRIRELMQKQNMTQSELSRKLGKDPAEINRWLSGMHTFTTKTLSKLHKVFGEPIVKICCETEEPPNNPILIQLMAEAL
jgi:ribosome-binding protein aMBF1 (putative translation factor)